VHNLPRKLTVDELAVLFEGRSRFVERLAGWEDPLGQAREALRRLPEEEQVEAVNAHPRVGAPRLSAASANEQGSGDDAAVLEQLALLNRAYEQRFGFRFLVFVNRRSKTEILEVLRRRIGRSRATELETALDDLVAIALDRYRSR
jgi:2-oxo-4-hydroxy-4-carboxy--5-ureidoimidazoline (OHCU) decarboxylase